MDLQEDQTVSSYQILLGDCLELMRAMEPESFHAIVTDPPYHLTNAGGGPHGSGLDTPYSRSRAGATTTGFMGQEWDGGDVAFRVETWAECLRVAKPGAHLLAFGGTRTYHRLACAIEDAGWEIRDCLMFLYGSGFPKSLNVQQAINKERRGCPQGSADPESPNHGKFKGGCSDENPGGRGFGAGAGSFMREQGAARGDDAGDWQGFGTALKPAYEPIILARKPIEGTVAQNVQKHGCGALDIDGSRIAGVKPQVTQGVNSNPSSFNVAKERRQSGPENEGRWPSNVLLDQESAAMLDGQVEPTNGDPRGHGHGHGGIWSQSSGEPIGPLYRDGGSVSRFFYTSKASQDERPEVDGIQHPTVKPLDLMRYLVGLVSREGDLILDPFAGSGTTLAATVGLGRNVIGCELNPEYVKLIEKRMQTVTPSLFATR